MIRIQTLFMWPLYAATLFLSLTRRGNNLNVRTGW
jgi:hypothetical protein